MGSWSDLQNPACITSCGAKFTANQKAKQKVIAYIHNIHATSTALGIAPHTDH